MKKKKEKAVNILNKLYWPIWPPAQPNPYHSVADPWEEPGNPLPPPHHFFLDQTEARRAEKNFLGDRLTPPPLSQGLDPALPFASVLRFLCVVTQRFFHKRLYMFLGRSVE